MNPFKFTLEALEMMTGAKQRTGENDLLRAELDSIRARLATLEHIVTDNGYRVAQEIEGLREPRIEQGRNLDKGMPEL